MPKNGYYITSDGNKVLIESDTLLELSNRDIIELVVPDGVETVCCWSNKLTSLAIPDGVTSVYCQDNNLASLNLPHGVVCVSCDNNNIASLKIPSSAREIHCDAGLVNASDYVNRSDVKVSIYF